MTTLLDWLEGKWLQVQTARRRARIERLRARGMKVGKDVVLLPDVDLDTVYPWLIEIEDGCRISSGVRVMAHDATSFRDLGVTRLGRVRILHDTFIAERVVILPGVTIGPRAMIAAGSVVSRDIGEGVLAAGNPARVYGQHEEYLARTREAAAAGRIVTLVEAMNGQAGQDLVRGALERGEAVYVSGLEPDTYHYNVSHAELEARAREAFQRHFGSRDRGQAP